MGFTLLESQACGTPVICTDAGAMSEFVSHGHTGFVASQNSGVAIADALRKIIDAPPAAYATYEERCREWIAPLCWPSVVREHLDMYMECKAGSEAERTT